ncbi:alpha/beta fold hydrolase [Nitrospirillum iridis]|uniref:Pimeloyl-ACP methyl ester carboxylesterase n=1 Tax=Nitrospirillum iridis TaxID=765888 RepID=A0A7X0EGW1_9PROT|nr:alpha/beta hydrolase [Nitrospirillum iridis]MBB6255345.1 pimeloyl-ACP methyl ester carboxylesterase [Nitrospirillum iridis]
MRRLVPFVLAATLATSPGFAGTIAPAAVEPIGIALEGWPYPFPVSYYEFTAGGQTLRQAYMDVAPAGKPNGRVALLLHGRNFPASYWEKVIRAFADDGYRVIATDQIGFGKSSKPDLPYSFDFFAANTAGLLDSLGVKQVDLVAHSLGGMLAARFTRTYPERVRRLVLEAPVGLEDYRLTVPPVSDAFLYDREYGLTADAYRDFLKNSYSISVPVAEIEPFVTLRERQRASGEYPRWVTSFIKSYQMIHDQPVVHEYPLIATPTLFIMGSSDHNAPGKPYTTKALGAGMGRNADNAQAIAATMPDAQVVVFDGVGHLPHVERPEAFNKAALGFLDR